MEATNVFKDTEVIIQFTEDHIVVLQKYGAGSWDICIWDEPIRSVRIKKTINEKKMTVVLYFAD